MYKKIEQLEFDISELAKRSQGATDEYALDQPLLLKDPDIISKGNIKGRVSIMKIDREFNVQLRDFELEVEQICSKCAEPYIQQLNIPFAEKQYAIDHPHKDDREEIGYVDVKHHSIDINEFLRQEIILHFPLISVCSTHCQGINQGINL